MSGPVYTVNIGGNNNESDLVIGSANAMINDAPDLSSIYLAIANLENSLSLNNDNDLLQESSIANNVSGIANNVSGIVNNASGISTNASGVSTNVSRLDVHESLITKTIKHIFHLPLGLKCLAENSHSMKTWLIAEHDGLENCFVYELYSDSNVSAVHSVKALKQGSNLLINFEHIKAHFYYSKEFSEELKSVLTNNTLVLTPLDPANPTPISEPMGYEHTGATVTNGHYSPDPSTLNNFKILDKYYYTPPYNPSYNTGTQGNFVMGYGSAHWANYSPGKSVATLTYNNIITFAHVPFWYHSSNDAIGKTYTVPDGKEVEIKKRDFSLEYSVNIEYVDDSFYPANAYIKHILVPEQELATPIVYDTKAYDKNGTIVYYSEEWGGYTCTKLKGKYEFVYSALHNSSRDAFNKSNDYDENNRNFISTFQVKPNLFPYITHREGLYCKSIMELNSWVYDDTLLGKMYDNINNENQYSMTKGSVQYPFGPSYYRGISTSTSRTGGINIRILAFDNPFPDPRPSGNANNSFKYEHLITNWEQPVSPNQFDILSFNPFYVSTGYSSIDQIKTVGKLTNPIKTLSFLSSSNTNGNYYTSQGLTNMQGSWLPPFGHATNKLHGNYLNNTPNTNKPFWSNTDSEVHSFRGYQQTFLTSSLIENGLYGRMYYNETTKKVEKVVKQQDKQTGSSIDRDGFLVHKNFKKYANTPLFSESNSLFTGYTDAMTKTIGQLVSWIETNLSDKEFMKNYPDFGELKTQFMEFLEENKELYPLGYSSSNNMTLEVPAFQVGGPNYNPQDINIPTMLNALIVSRYLDASNNPTPTEIMETYQRTHNPSHLNINENWPGIGMLNYRDKEDFFDPLKGNQEPFIDWYSNPNKSSEELYNASVTQLLNGGKLGHTLTTHMDYVVVNAMSGFGLGTLLENKSFVVEPIEELKSNSYYKSLKHGVLRLYANKWKKNEDYFRDYQSTDWFENTGSIPVIGEAQGKRHACIYSIAPRASEYNANNEPVAQDFVVNGISRKLFVQHDFDTIVAESNPVLFKESSKKINYDESNEVPKKYRIGIWADNKTKWGIIPSETVKTSSYTLDLMPQCFGAYGSLSHFYDEVYSEAELLANNKNLSDYKTIKDSNGTIKYYYKIENRFWKGTINAIGDKYLRFFIDDDLKEFLRSIRPGVIFDNDEHIDEKTREKYAQPTFTKGNNKNSGLISFDVANLGRNRGTSSGVSQHGGGDINGNEIAALYSSANLETYENANVGKQKNMIVMLVKDINKKIQDGISTKGKYFNPLNNNKYSIENIYDNKCHFQTFNDMKQVLYGAKFGRLLYRRDMVYNSGLFNSSNCVCWDDCTDYLANGLSSYVGFLDEDVKNVEFSGPELELCCHLGKPELMEDPDEGIPKKQYNVSLTFDPSFTKFTIDYTNNRTDMGVVSYKHEDVPIVQTNTNDLGVYFEKANTIRGRFVACNNMHRPYVLFSQLQIYNASTSAWDDEIPDYGDFLKSNEGGLPNSPYLTHKFNCLSLPANEILNIYRITADGIQFSNFAFSDDGAKTKYAGASPGDLIERADHGFIVQNGFTASNFNIYDAPIYKITADGIQYANYAFSDDAAKAKYAAASPGDYVDQVDVEFIVQNGFTASNFNIYNAPIYAITADGIQYANFAFSDDAAKAKYAAASPGDFVDQADVEFIVQNGFTASNFKIY